MWQDLFAAAEGIDSVHLAAWPTAEADAVDAELAADVAAIRTLVDLGRSARAESGVRTRQPLGRALVSSTRWAGMPDDLRAQFADEVNVLTTATLDGGAGDLVEVTVKPNFRALGRRFGKRTRWWRGPRRDPGAEVAAALRDGGGVEVKVETADDAGGEVQLLVADEVIVTERPVAGWSVASTDGATVALDLQLDEALVQLGLAARSSGVCRRPASRPAWRSPTASRWSTAATTRRRRRRWRRTATRSPRRSWRPRWSKESRRVTCANWRTHR